MNAIITQNSTHTKPLATPGLTSVKAVTSNRVRSIDWLRGLVMVLMALDHARVFFHHGTFFSDPTDLATTSEVLFFTRWITHFCAPIFIFLAGTSAFLYGQKSADKSHLSRFLWTRGLWLIAVELVIVNFAWTFDPTLSLHIFQVIWVIGVAMICLSGLMYLPRPAILSFALLMLFGHNLLDGIQFQQGSAGWLIWSVLHVQTLIPLTGEHFAFVLYPWIPWIGVMALGYLFGQLYTEGTNAAIRRRWLLYLGGSAILLFLVLRSLNIYGDAAPWSWQESIGMTIVSFLNTTKYPPSLLYLLMTLGPAILSLRYLEGISNRISDNLVILGRVPFFFYIAHLYLVHLLATGTAYLTGTPVSHMVLSSTAFLDGTLSSFGFDLWVVYGVWVVMLAILLPLSSRYHRYKRENRAKWWLSYL